MRLTIQVSVEVDNEVSLQAARELCSTLKQSAEELPFVQKAECRFEQNALLPQKMGANV